MTDENSSSQEENSNQVESNPQPDTVQQQANPPIIVVPIIRHPDTSLMTNAVELADFSKKG